MITTHRIHLRTASGWHCWRSYRLCQLFPRHRHIRRRKRYQDPQDCRDILYLRRKSSLWISTASTLLADCYQLDYMTNVSCFFSEFLGASILVIVLFAVLDRANAPPPGMLPLVI